MVGRGRAAPSSGRMNDWPELLALAERQYGLVTREQIRRLGGSQAAVLRVARSSQWEPVTKHVLRRRGSPRTVDQMVMAAVLDAGGDATLAYLPGAAWWGVAGCVLDPLVLCTTKKARTRTGLATTHEVRWLPDRWVTELRGVRVARPELLAMQLHAICRPERAEVLVDRMWSRRLLSGPSIAQFIDEAGASGRNGITGLRAYFQPRGLKYIPPASGLEGRVKGLLGDAGIPMRPQVDSEASAGPVGSTSVTSTSRSSSRSRVRPTTLPSSTRLRTRSASTSSWPMASRWSRSPTMRCG